MKHTGIILLFLFTVASLPAQTVSNVRAKFTDCRIEVEYDLATAGPVNLTLEYTGDDGETWIPCTSVSGNLTNQNAGINKRIIWNNRTDKIYWGKLTFRVVEVSELYEYVMINGVCWATCNVGAPGKLVKNPENTGMYYQWNRKIGWSATDPMINTNGGATWDNTVPKGTAWEKANDPSPAGWHVPVYGEIEKLFDTERVSNQWTSVNGINGRRFTDKGTGNSIFLPAAGQRNRDNGMLVSDGSVGAYWSGTQHVWSGTPDSIIAYGWHVNDGTVIGLGYDFNYSNRKAGHNVRPVCEKPIPVTTYLSDYVCMGNDYNKHNFSLGVQDRAGCFIHKKQLKTASTNRDSLVVLTITVSPVPEVAIVVKNNPLCKAGSEVSLLAVDNAGNPGNTDPATVHILDCSIVYLWSTGKTGSSISVAPLTTTTYTVTATNSCSFSATASQTVFNNITSQTVNAEVCGQYLFKGKYLRASGIYRDTIPAANGCDSIIILNLTVYPVDTVRLLPETIYVGEGYRKNGFDIPVQHTAGSLPDTLHLKNSYGCDSTVILQLAVICPNQAVTTLSATVCQGETYEDNGFSLPLHNEAGAYDYQQQLITAAAGCDSIVKLHLLVTPAFKVALHDRIDVGEPYSGNDFTLPPHENPGVFVYEQQYKTSEYLCDSTITLTLTVFFEIYPDKLFTPNGDGVNDFWTIKNIELHDVEFVKIYDRSGKLLKHYDKSFTPWDGKYLGKPCPSTDYWYIIKLEGGDARIGHFSLIR
jgi:gliding motility-associated-like protein